MTDEEREELASLRLENASLREFKKYTHDRLDAAGIPVDPDSPHKAEGCRIGGRLDFVFEQRSGLVAAAMQVVDSIDGSHAQVMAAVGNLKLVAQAAVFTPL